MGMYVTIADQEVKFSGLLALAYQNLFYDKKIDNHVVLKWDEIPIIVDEMARLFDATPMGSSYSLSSINARRLDLAKMSLLLDEYTYGEPHDLVFA